MNIFSNTVWLGGEPGGFNSDDTNAPVIHHPGGAMSITVGGPGGSLNGRSGLAAEPVHTYRPSDGLSQSVWVGHDGSAELRSSRQLSVNVSEGTNGQTGILSTARSSFSNRPLQPSELKPTDFVSIGSLKEVSVEMAVQLGYLVPDPINGGYREPGGHQPQARQPLNAQPQGARLDATNIYQDGFNTATEAPSNNDAGTELVALSEPAEKALMAVTQIVPRDMQHSAAVSFADSGTLSNTQITQLAEASGLDPETTAVMLGGMQREFFDQAVKITGSMGVDSYEDFAEWAEQHHREEFADAVLKHITTRSPKAAYADLAARYVETLADRDPEAVLGAEVANGIKTYWDAGNKQVMVTLPNGLTTSYRAAVQRGLIRVSKVA